MTDPIPAYLKPEINRLDQKIAEAKASLADPQLKTLAQEEIDQLEQQKQALLQPAPAKTINKAVSISGGSIIIEVRPGAGGEEAKIWAEDLLNMYTRFSNGQRLEVLKLADGV
ncbi:MAG: PCRF domain-containing protein, partial [Patescibacteria group bacterium]|nr:PCRF domain-containing protein [Patescibacteria group bacterium]